jgi:hypothetical protein
VSASARHAFDAQDVTIAVAVAVLAQLGFVAAFSMPTPKLVEADISNDNAQPIAVAITPVLKLGSKTPEKLPSTWQRRAPVPAKTPKEAALPSPQAAKTPEAIPTTSVPDAAVAPVTVDASRVLEPTPNAPVGSGTAAPPVASTEGVEQGAANGTETDPLKARAADQYRAQLVAWFIAHFHIRGKIPFEDLKRLHSTTTVTITPDRRVASFVVNQPSGDPIFDGEVQSTLSQIESSGVELPAPPPDYPDILRSTLPIRFVCNIQKNCE